jgi:hypothetical protein
MGDVSTIGLDIAKSVFQVHGVDVAGAVVIRKRVSRAKVLEYFGDLPPCLAGIEASALPAFSVAQSQEVGRSRRIAVLADSRGEGVVWQAFFETLGRGGFVEGRNLQIDRRGFSVRSLLLSG